MIIIPADKLKANMVSAQTLTDPDSPSAALLTAGSTIDHEIISQILQRNIPAVAITLPQCSQLDPSGISDATTGIYSKLKFQLAQHFTSRDPKISIDDYTRLSSACSAMVTSLLRDRSNGCKFLSLPLICGKQSLEKHCANVAYMSLALALSIEGFMVEERRSAGALAACDVTNLAVGAALHDIGKIKIPSTLEIHQPSENAPSRSYIQHAIIGPNMISQRVSPTARSVVMHHHQYFDGSGFPDMAMVTSKRKNGTLSDRGIHIFSRIVTICDHLDNLRPKNHPFMMGAMKELLSGKWSNRFDPYLIWSISKLVPPMPIGAHIKMTDGSNAIVSAHNPKNPCRPELLLLDKGFKPITVIETEGLGNNYPQIKQCMGIDVSELSYKIPPEPKDSSSAKEIHAALITE